MVQKDSSTAAAEDHDLDVLVGLDGRYDLAEFQNKLWTD